MIDALAGGIGSSSASACPAPDRRGLVRRAVGKPTERMRDYVTIMRRCSLVKHR
jgi:hypothetical protein